MCIDRLGECLVAFGAINRRVRSRIDDYLGLNRDEAKITGSEGSRLLLIGGQPFDEPILMWWNFVARTKDEIAKAREDWMHHQRFGEVKAYKGSRLAAPDLASFAPANAAS